VLPPKYKLLGPTLNKLGTVKQSRPALFGALLILGAFGKLQIGWSGFRRLILFWNDYETTFS
jgi:hypothetical protein